MSSGKYTTQLASDVLERDGIGCELVAEDESSVAEVFQDDTTGETTVRIFDNRPVLLVDLEWFLAVARKRLQVRPDTQ